MRLSGQSARDKIQIVQKHLREANCPFLVSSSLDEIAWVLNVRGSDIKYNPVVRSYLVIPDTGPVHWFLPQDSSREIEPEARLHLGLDSSEPLVTIYPYEGIESFLTQHIVSLTCLDTAPRVLGIAPNQLNWKLYSAISNSLSSNASLSIRSTPSVLTRMKSVKNDAELEGMRQSHIRDGVALTAFFAWLDRLMRDARDRSLPSDQLPTEFEVAEVLESYRAQMTGFVSLAFASVSGYGPNGRESTTLWRSDFSRSHYSLQAEQRDCPTPGTRFALSLRLWRAIRGRDHRCHQNAPLWRAHAMDEGMLHSSVEGLSAFVLI
jgi:Xaa-Pro aminopeptidase